MNKEKVGWQVTATTLFCDVVDEWVTILVYKDGTTKCSHVIEHGQTGRKTGKDEWQECPGPSACALCTAYKEKVFSENTEIPSS